MTIMPAKPIGLIETDEEIETVLLRYPNHGDLFIFQNNTLYFIKDNNVCLLKKNMKTMPDCFLTILSDTLIEASQEAMNELNTLTGWCLGKTAYVVKNPPFGSDYNLTFYEERTMSGFKDELQQHVTQSNEQKMQTRHFMLNPVKGWEQHKKNFILELNLLETDIKKSCESTKFENFFNTKEHQTKKAVVNVLNRAVDTLLQFLQNSIDYAQETMPWLNELKMHIQQCTKQKDHPLIKQLEKRIENFKEKIGLIEENKSNKRDDFFLD